MKNVLIASERTEIAKLFELLLRQQDRQFVSAKSLTQCLEQADKSGPALILIDTTLAEPQACLKTLARLKESAATSRIPVYLIGNLEQENREEQQLRELAEGLFTEPLNLAEIKKVAQKHL